MSKKSFLKHGSEFSKQLPSHATSMLDLSARAHYHQTSRSRHSLALLQPLPSSSLTPKSSFRRRPPSVASYHHLFATSHAPASAAGHAKAKYSQYFFGAIPSKSESTLSVPLHLSSNFFCQNNSASGKQHPLNNIKESDNEKCNLPNQSECSANVPSNAIDSSRFQKQISDPGKPDRSPPPPTKTGKLKELFHGLANARSSFKRRSIRKAGSDASTFYSRHNLKRSQIAQNQLTNILYNNFYNKKIGPVFGSQITLLSEVEKDKIPDGSLLSQIQNRHLSYDFSSSRPLTQFASPHVYLPNANHLESNNRSNSCQQLSGSKVDTGHYHNHLLLKQNLFDSPRTPNRVDNGKIAAFCLQFESHFMLYPPVLQS